MKTRSKRFLNLATLCLALLGTTLLMEQPVKAEGTPSESTLSVSNDEDKHLREQYLKERGLTDGNGLNEYDKEGARGYVDGYKAGSKTNAPEDPVAEGSYNPENHHNSGYNDGYETGYYAGRRKANDNSRSLESSGESHTPKEVEDPTSDSSD
ncbi:TPA: hypothetical protein ACQNVW_001743, partial [Streptococcus pyogenes]